jgi:hypothetical protein
MDSNTGNIVVKVVRTSRNMFVLEEGKEKCCIVKTNESLLWNKMLGHLSFNHPFKLGRKYYVKYIPKISKPENIFYKSCLFGKQSRVQFNAKQKSTTRPLELIHTNICGPISTQSL